MMIGKVFNKDGCTVKENATLQEAAKLMADENIGFLVVISDNEATPTGTVTDRDIVVKAIAKYLDVTDTKVSEIMCKDLLTLDETQGIGEIIELMSEKKIRRIPIVNNNKVSGVVSMDDLLSLLAKEINTLAEIPREQNA